MITKENIEAYLLDFIEGNLSQEEIKDLEAFLKDNPEYKEMLSLYDSSLVLMADENIKFEDKDTLRRKNNKKAFYPFIKYSFVAVAACIILFVFVSKLFIKPLDNTNIKSFDNVIVQNTNNSSSPVLKADKEIFLKEHKQISKHKQKTIAKSEKSQAKEIPVEVKEEVKPEPEILLSNNMVVYEVDNLIAYKQEEDINENKIIEVDNLVVYNDTPAVNPILDPIINNKYVDQLKHNFEKTQNGFNNALAYIQNNIKYNPFESLIAKK